MSFNYLKYIYYNINLIDLIDFLHHVKPQIFQLFLHHLLLPLHLLKILTINIQTPYKYRKYSIA